MVFKRNLLAVFLLCGAFGGNLALGDDTIKDVIDNSNVGSNVGSGVGAVDTQLIKNEKAVKTKKTNAKNSERAWRFPVGIFAGTSGIGVKVGFEYNYIGIYGTFSTFGTKHFGMKNGFKVNYQTFTKLYGGDDYSVYEAHSGTMMANIQMADYGIDLRVKPFNGAFHIDIGYHYMDYRLTLTSFLQDGSNMEFEGITIDNVALQQDVVLRIAKGFKPYFGLGWDWRVTAQFYITLDFGIMYTGKWQIDVPNMDFSSVESAIVKALKDKVGDANYKYDDVRNMISENVSMDKSDIDDYIRTATKNGVLNVNGLVSDNGSIDSNISISADDMAKGIANGMVTKTSEEYAEKIANVNGKKLPIPIWPVIKLGLVYKF